jgi:hypothetical protein
MESQQSDLILFFPSSLCQDTISSAMNLQSGSCNKMGKRIVDCCKRKSKVAALRAEMDVGTEAMKESAESGSDPSEGASLKCAAAFSISHLDFASASRLVSCDVRIRVG